jgi:preprotein translocase subunit SecG
LLVLIQSGKGAEISASFGGSSQTVFGSSGGANFFQKFTFGAAGVFVVTSILLTIMGGQSKKSLFENVPTTSPVTQTAPAVPAAPAAQQQPAAPAAPAVPAEKK